MSQRHSGYKRKAGDRYYSPPWVVQALLPYLPSRLIGTQGSPPTILEPAAGKNAIADELWRHGFNCYATDLKLGDDFLKCERDFDAVITNPPYGLAEEFICRSLLVTQKRRGFVAMLLATDFDHGKTRRHLFGGCPQFATKLVLTKRIVWFKRVIAAPSSNHAWFMWDWRSKRVPWIAYYYEEGK